MESTNGLAVIPESTVREIISRKLAFDAVRKAFEAVARDGCEVFDVVVGTGLNPSEAFAIKSGKDNENRLVGFKFGSYWGGNFDKGLPAHSSNVILLDPETGFPHLLVNGSYMNGYRTAAANAVAVTFLARPESEVLGVIGAGHQAEHEIRAVAAVRPLSLVKISTRSGERADWMAGRLADLDIETRFTDAEDAVRGSDIVATVTPATSPVVLDDWVEEGTHISAMGADVAGKCELDVSLLRRARLFAEYPTQSIRIGEFQNALREGVVSSEADICALGLVTLGEASGRESDADITVFDSSGIAAQDLAVASAVFEAAKAAGQVQIIDW